MKKKIIALFLSCVMCISVLVIPASANVTNIPSNMNHFIDNVSEDFNSYRNGNISLADFIDLYTKNVAKFQYNSTADILQIKDVLQHLQKLGVDVPEKWTQWFYENKMGGDGSGGNRDDSVLNGYGAVCIQKIHSRSDDVVQNTHIYYGNYGIIKDGVFANIYAPKIICKYTDNSHNADTVTYEYKDVTSIGGAFMNDTYNYAETLFYGDWRYENGDKANDNITELPEKVPPKFDDDNVSENDLIDFLDKLLEDLRLNYPDLSTLEGLLNAILAKLDTLDSDDDGQLLAEINTAIITLASDNHADNQAIIALLTELKESLKKGTATDLSKVEDKLSKIQKSLDYLCTINTIDTGVDIWKELTETEKTILSEYAALITTLLPKFGLTAVNNVIMSMNSVLLNNTPPSDLTADVFGERVTILSSDMFDGEAMQYIDLVKTFISVLLIYSFCLILRRKIAGGGS